MKKLFLLLPIILAVSCSNPYNKLLKPYRHQRSCHKEFFQKIAITKYEEYIKQGCSVSESIEKANVFTHNIIYVMARDQPEQLERNICKKQSSMMRGNANIIH